MESSIIELTGHTLLVLVATMCFGYICVQGRKIVRFLYLTTKIPHLSIREYIHAYVNGFFNDNMLQQSLKLCEAHQHKPFGVWIGPMYCLSISDCDSMSQVLKSKTIIDKPEVIHKVGSKYLGKGLLTLNGPGYRRHRKILSPAFRLSILESQVPKINAESAKLVTRFRAEAVGESVDVRSLVTDHADDLAMLILATQRCDPEKLEKWLEVGQVAGIQIHMRMTNPVYYWCVHKLKWTTRETEAKIKEGLAAAKAVLREARGLISRLSEVDERPTCLLDAIAVGDAEDDFSDEEFLDECITLLAGAAETTGFAMNVSLLLLALHQEVQQRVYHEVLAVIGKRDRPVRPDDLNEMVYLDMFVKETLRMFPPIPYITRQVHQESKIADLLLPKGCVLGLNTFALHRNPDVFQDPLTFDPDRFSAERSKSRHRFAFLPFSYGIRSCPGQMQGIVMLKIFVCHMIRNFRILPGDGLTSVKDIKVKMYFTCFLRGSSLRFICRTD